MRTFVCVDDESGVDVAGLATDDYEEALAAASPERDFAERSGDDLYILYTGGTTGMPKGVMWRQEDIFFAAMDMLGHGPGRAARRRPRTWPTGSRRPRAR